MGARLEPQVVRLQAVVGDIPGRLTPMIIRIDAQISHLSTKADLERRATRAGMRARPIALPTLTLAGMAAGAIQLPFPFRVMHMPAPNP